MASAEEIATTAIFDATHKCAELINQITLKYDESILTHSFVPDDVGSSSKPENNKHSSRDFIGLRNSFSFWIDYTGALSHGLVFGHKTTRFDGYIFYGD